MGCLIAAACGVACSTTPVGEGVRHEIIADATPFFRFGPEQPAGPDSTLGRGREVLLLKRGYGYSQVQLEDGAVGYIGTEALSRVPLPDPTPEPTPEASAFSDLPSASDPQTLSASDDVIVERYFLEDEVVAPLPAEPNPAGGLFGPGAAPTDGPVIDTGSPDFRY